MGKSAESFISVVMQRRWVPVALRHHGKDFFGGLLAHTGSRTVIKINFAIHGFYTPVLQIFSGFLPGYIQKTLYTFFTVCGTLLFAFSGGKGYNEP